MKEKISFFKLRDEKFDPLEDSLIEVEENNSVEEVDENIKAS